MNTLILFFSVISICFGSYEPARKQLAGPPTEFKAMEIPQIESTFTAENSAVLNLDLTQCPHDETKVEQQVDLYVDSDSYFQFSVLSEIDLTFTLTDPQGNAVSLENVHNEYLPVGDSGNEVPAKSWFFVNPMVGIYKLSIESETSFTQTEIEKILSNQGPDAIVVLYNDCHRSLDVYINTWDLETGKQVGLVGQMVNNDDGTVDSAEMDVIFPSGKEEEIEMKDDGESFDGAANDNIYGGIFTATEAGTYNAEALFIGTTSTGVKFMRSVQLPFAVVDDHLELTGVAYSSVASSGRILFNLGVSGASDAKYRAYAEVYHVADGVETAVAWIGAMANVASDKQIGFSVTLELDPSWLSLAGVSSGSYVLKSVSLQCSQTFDLITSKDEIIVKANPQVDSIAASARSKKVTEITEEMVMGIRPIRFVKSALNVSNADVNSVPKLLSHGYCSSDNPWEVSATEFSVAHYFLDRNANRANDVFALSLAKYAEDRGIGGAWSGIGHSQGGMALAHLYNYYWTGLDSTAGRRIQSVGSPYKGNSMAGSTANFGKLFGVGCGSNNDMTTGGAAAWNTGITSATRSQVYYYTTTYKLGSTFGDYCSLLANSILQWPNDGVTEVKYADLDGANFMGNTEKWCHTTGQGYTAQYFDETRNALMNSAA